MSLAEINTVPDPVKKKGGLGGVIGSIIGGATALGAAVAAPFTAGTSLSAIPAVLGGIGAAAPVIGGMADPAKAEGGGLQAPVSQINSQKLQVMQEMPEVQLATIANARKQIPTAKMPQDEAVKAMDLLDAAHAQLTDRLNRGMA